MEFVKLSISPTKRYFYRSASSIEMNILGDFLASDVGYRPLPFKEWSFNNTSQNANGSLTSLKKNNNDILLTDIFGEEETSATLKISQEKFVQLLVDWQEKVCNEQPQEIVIKQKDNMFIIETNILNEHNVIKSEQEYVVTPHSYPLWIKIGFFICCIIFSLYCLKIPTYLKFSKQIRKAKNTFFQQKYTAAQAQFSKLSQKLPLNKEIKLYLVYSLFKSPKEEDHMTALQMLTKESLDEREWQRLLNYMPVEYVQFFKHIKKEK